MLSVNHVAAEWRINVKSLMYYYLVGLKAVHLKHPDSKNTVLIESIKFQSKGCAANL